MQNEVKTVKTLKKKLTQNIPISIPKIGEIVKGKVIDKGRASVFLDLGAFGTGIIYGKEFYEAKEQLRNIKVGDEIFAKIIELENEEGYIELSLSKAGREIAWEKLSEKKINDETLKVKILGANKGGLLTEVLGITAFLPVSQLSSKNYPKVEDGDTQKILKHLQKFVGKEMEVKVLDLDPNEEKLILSEKAKEINKIKEIVKKYKIGDIVEVEATGIADFGVFVKILDEEAAEKEIVIEGLIHISELSWQLVEDPREIVKLGEKFKAKIINIENEKVSLSLKALQKNPWEGIEKKFKKGDIIKGKVIKINPFGLFVQLAPKIQGLCHISEIGSQKKMKETFELGKEYNFQILSINPEEYKITLKPIKE